MKRTQLKRNKPLNKISKKQVLKNKHWRLVTDERVKEENGVCQWCGKEGSTKDEVNPLDGHHIIKRRYNIHDKDNCYIVHRWCHREIEDKNIDVGLDKSREMWFNRVGNKDNFSVGCGGDS